MPYINELFNAKITDYVIAAFTIAIAWFTLGLRNATLGLFTATKELADETTKGVTKQVETLAKAERAYISGGGPSIAKNSNGFVIPENVLNANGQPHAPTHFRVTVNNYGKSPGELIYYFVDFTHTVPTSVPINSETRLNIPFQDWIAPNTQSRPLNEIEIPHGKPIVYGRFYYRDVILNKFHSSGFLLQIQPTIPVTIPIAAPKEFRDERDEDDITTWIYRPSNKG